MNTKVEIANMTGRHAFGLVKGATFVLNPYSTYSREFSPEETELILKTVQEKDKAVVTVLTKPTDSMFAQPSVYPERMIVLLKQLFSNRPEVSAAYMAWGFCPEFGDPPHYIFALKAETTSRDLSQEAYLTIKPLLAATEIVDFFSISKDGSGISNYFLTQTTPFYHR